MSEKITYTLTVGGPLQVHVKDGKIRRVRPLVLKDDDPKGWVIEAGGRQFTPPRRTTVTAVSLQEKDKAYSYDRVKYPLIREDFDVEDRKVERRGKSGYRRATWDEALGLVAGEIRRVQETYGKEAVTACTGSHHTWGLLGYKMSAFKRFFNLLGYTAVLDNPDSWEGFHWGATHTYGHYWRLGCPEQFDLLEDALQNCETLVLWSHDPDSTHGCYSANESAVWRHWIQELGIMVIYVDPFNNFSSVKMGDKWLAPRPGTDSALMEGMAYVWLTEGTYDKEYVAEHVHRFEEWADHILGRGSDGVPKTPEWAAELTGINVATIKAFARRWASTRTMGCSGMRGGWGGAVRTTGGCDYARLLVQLFAMQGMGKPGSNMWTTNTGAPMNYDFWFGGYADPRSTIANQPVADVTAVNSVTQKIYRPNIPKAILTGHDEWLGDGFCGQSLEQQFVKHVYPEPGCSPVHLLYRYGGSFFGTMLDTNCWVDMYHSPELEFVVSQDMHLNPESRFADVILPACTSLERTDIGEFGSSGSAGYSSHSQSGNNWQVIVYQEKAVEPLGESQSDYWIFSKLAERLGFGLQYTEGRDEEAWCKRFYDTSSMPSVMTWEQFKRKGYYVIPVPERQKSNPAFRWFYEGRPCDTPSHQPCQEKGSLGTPTGKFEFVAEMLEEKTPDDPIRTPIAGYKDSREGHRSVLYQKYPFHLISPHPRFGFHTHFDQHNKWLWEVPEHRKVVEGNPYAVARIHPEQAAVRGISDGDIIRMFNDRGGVLAVAKLTRRVKPETIHCYASSGIYEPLTPGERSDDKGGCVNLLTDGALIGDNVPGMAPNSTLIEIEKYNKPLVPGMHLTKLLDAAGLGEEAK